MNLIIAKHPSFEILEHIPKAISTHPNNLNQYRHIAISKIFKFKLIIVKNNNLTTSISNISLIENINYKEYSYDSIINNFKSNYLKNIEKFIKSRFTYLDKYKDLIRSIINKQGLEKNIRKLLATKIIQRSNFYPKAFKLIYSLGF